MSDEEAPLSARLRRFSDAATKAAQDKAAEVQAKTGEILRKVSFERRTKVVRGKAEEASVTAREIITDFKDSEPKYYPCCFLTKYPEDGSVLPAKPPYLKSSSVLPQEMRRGTSDISSYDNRELAPNLAVEMKLKAPADVLLYNFRDLFRVVQYGEGERPANLANVQLGMITKGLGPLCLDDQVVEWDQEAGKMVLQTTAVGAPLSCCCKGYTMDLWFAPDAADPSYTTFRISTAHDYRAPCFWVPQVCYPVTLVPTLLVFGKCMQWQASGSYGCWPKCCMGSLYYSQFANFMCCSIEYPQPYKTKRYPFNYEPWSGSKPKGHSAIPFVGSSEQFELV